MSLETVNVRRLGLAPHARLLDLGCGEGRHAIAAHVATGANVVAVDLGVSALSSARERYRAYRAGAVAGGVGFACGDGYALPFADASFDAVVCAEVLEHVHDYAAMLAEIARVLRPGGHLAISVPRYGPERVCWWLCEAYHQVPGGHVRIFRSRELERAVIATGMVSIARHGAHALHAPYWWLRCAFWERGPDHPLVRAWHRLLVWDLLRSPAITRGLDRLLNPLMGKSVVMYFTKEANPALHPAPPASTHDGRSASIRPRAAS